MKDILYQQYWGNSILDYVIASVVIILGTLIVRILKATILRRIKKWTETTDTQNDNYVNEPVLS